MELFKAHHQWAERPADERFSTLQQLWSTCKGYADRAAEATVDWKSLKVQPYQDENIALVGKRGNPATVSNWAFSQLCARAGAPTSYLRTLPTDLAVTNLNHGLRNRSEGAAHDAQLLFHKGNGNGLVLRAVTTDIYERIWNWEIAERLMDLTQRFNLKPAVATFRQQDNDAPALYASDHDMFVFLMDRERNIGGSGDGLFRGIIISNSEVGAGALAMMWFLFCDICGNHIIWGAKDVTEARIIHKGQVRQRWGKFSVNVKKYLDSSPSDEQAMIKATRSFEIADDKEGVLDALFGNRRIGLSRKVLEASYAANVRDEDGDPNTAWGFVQGLTRHSQTLPHMDERTRLDKAGRNVLQMAF